MLACVSDMLKAKAFHSDVAFNSLSILSRTITHLESKIDLLSQL